MSRDRRPEDSGLAGEAPERLDRPGAPLVAVSTRPARGAPAASPDVASPERGRPLYYADLGSDELDVSAYPPGERANYAAYRSACARCHGLARSLHSPRESRSAWRRAIARMRFHTRLHRLAGIPVEEREAALAFLAYDSQVRKTGRRAAYEREQADLKRRFQAKLGERMELLQREVPPGTP